MAMLIPVIRTHFLFASGMLLACLLAVPVRAERPLHQLTLPRAEQGHHYVAMAMAFSNDGSLLAIASHDRVFVYDMAGGRLQGTYRVSGEFTGDMLYDVGFSPDGDQVHALRSTAFDDDPVEIAEGLQGFAGNAEQPEGGIPDGFNASIEVITWEITNPNAAPQLQKFQMPRAFTVHEASYVGDFSPTQSMVAICSTGGLGDEEPVYLFNLESSAQVELENIEGQELLNYSIACFSGDGRYLIALGTGAAIWEVETGNLFHTIDGDFHNGLALLSFNATLTPTHEQLLAAHEEGYSLWNLETGQREAAAGNVPQPNGPQAASYTPSAFSRDARAVAILSPRGQMQMWDTGTGEAVEPFWAARNAYKDIALAPAGDRVALLREDQSSVFVWQVPEDAIVHAVEEGEEPDELAGEDTAGAATTSEDIEDLAEDAAEAVESPEPATPAGETPAPPRQPLASGPERDARMWTIGGEPVEAALVRAGSISILLITAEGEELRVPRGEIGAEDESYLEGLNR